MNESDKNEVQVIEQETRRDVAVQATGSTPADLLLYVMKSGGSIAEVREFMQLKREYEADEARKAYVEDMARFKMNPPTIVKDKQVAFSGTSYTHATLGNVTNAIVEGLAQHGFSHRWDLKQDGQQITVICTITHRMGHAESVSMQAGRDDSGKKNAIQQVASTVTYLQRYTLLAATGLATHDQSDDDGESAGARRETPQAQQAAAKTSLLGPRFDQALNAIRAGKYSADEMRGYYALTPDQETMLADVVKELAK